MTAIEVVDEAEYQSLLFLIELRLDSKLSRMFL
jgi:hypothetical protein